MSQRSWLAMRLLPVAAACFLAQAPARAALSLVEAWQAAQQHDLEFAAARYAHEAGQARRDQAGSVWRPNVVATAMAGQASNEMATSGAQFAAPGFGVQNGAAFNTSVIHGTTTRWSVAATQPLISGERDARKRQLQVAAELADLEWDAAQQALILHTAQRYLDAAVAAESLRVMRGQQQAVERALAETRERFALGDVKATDIHEATARAEAVHAQVLVLEAELRLRRRALRDTTGLDEGALDLMIPAGKGTATADSPGTLDHWLDEARRGNLRLRIEQASVDVAKQEAKKFGAAAAPTVDLVAQVGRERLSGNGDFGPAVNSLRTNLIGVQVAIPIYTGGYRSARQEEALRLADKAGIDAERTAQDVALQTQAAWLGLSSGAARVQALAASAKASAARLDATRLGVQVGDRTTLDLLNAENDAANAQLALLQARAALLLDRMRLASLAGALDAAVLDAISAALSPASAR